MKLNKKIQSGTAVLWQSRSFSIQRKIAASFRCFFRCFYVVVTTSTDIGALMDISGGEADQRAGERARDDENGQIQKHALGAEDEPGHQDLAKVVKNAARNADADGREELCPLLL